LEPQRRTDTQPTGKKEKRHQFLGRPRFLCGRIMVYAKFQDVAIQCWEHTAPRLGRARPFICLQAAAAACDILLLALDELAAEGVPSSRKMTLAASNRKRHCTKIRLLLSPATEAIRQMSLTKNGDVATFEFTRAGLPVFRDAVELWKGGGEDFSIHPRTDRKQEFGEADKASGEVWFWTPNTSP
jgi:hypothetical protein